jgi:hypothetical protein
MPWNPNDQFRLQSALNLNIDQRYPSSTLWVMMELAQQKDNQYQMGIVAAIQSWLTELEQLIDNPPAASDELVESVSIANDISVTYRSDASPVTKYRAQIESKRSRILTTLDPNRVLQRYVERGGIVPT